jgi:hypothetical protein
LKIPRGFNQGPVKDLGTDIIAGVRPIKSEDGPDLIVWGSSTRIRKNIRA